MNDNTNSRQSLFDLLISELLNSEPEQSLVDICLSGNQKAIASIPLRYRLIALGFVRRMSLQELNDKLRENSCEQLYARSLSEATLIYAFSKGLSYEEWKEVHKEASLFRDEISSDSYLSAGTVSLNDISGYVMSNSVYDNELARTLHMTRLMQESLSDQEIAGRDLNSFILSNIASFCSYREKSRYYFCKYLMYYLEYRRDRYLDAIDAGMDAGKALEFLTVFKSVTKLRRRKHSRAEAYELINSSGISFGAVYKAFQDLYFEYTSQDWMDILLDKYGDIDDLSPKQKKALASHIRKYNKSKASLSDSELLEWQQQELERKENKMDEQISYQANRAGENFLRKIIRGELDLDRTTLMAFMVFFDSSCRVPEEHRVTLSRLDVILTECGFASIDRENFVDDFFADYMSSDDPVTFLIEEAEIMAMSEENFYLYKTYLSSRNNEKDWRKMTLTQPI